MITLAKLKKAKESIQDNPSRLWRNWFVHNVFGHPASQLVKTLTGNRELARKIHQNTTPRGTKH